MSPSTPPEVVLLVNPNTNERTTRLMRSYAAERLAQAEMIGVTASAGPAMIIDPQALEESVPHVLDAVRDVLAQREVDAVIVGAVGDPGREQLADLLEIPVVGIGEASILAASSGGRPFAMATSTPLLADSLADLVHHYGRGEHFLGVELTESPPLDLAADPERQYEELAAATSRGVARGAEAVIIAGGPLSETARRLAATAGTTIVEPIPAACALLRERLPDLGATDRSR